MGRFLVSFAIFALIVYSLVDVARSQAEQVRLMPRWLWVLAIVLVPPFGTAFWFVLGRPRAGYGPPGGGGGIGGGSRPSGPGPIAPDDDPAFLKRLDEQSWAARMERLRREREAGGGGAGEDQGAGGSPSDRG